MSEGPSKDTSVIKEDAAVEFNGKSTKNELSMAHPESPNRICKLGSHIPENK